MLKFTQDLLHILVEEPQGYTYDFQKPLYIKGLYNFAIVTDDSKIIPIAAIGAAICDSCDDLILNVEKALNDNWENDSGLEDLQFKVDVKALREGFYAAISLGIKKVDVFCDYYPLFEYIIMRLDIDQKKIGPAVDQVCLLQQEFDSFCLFFVSEKDIALQLVRDAMDSQITRCAQLSRARNSKEKCRICLEDADVDQMLEVDGCSHYYCISCMKQHAEVKLLHEKVYCPYPSCSMLMSKSEVLPYADAVSIEWSAVKCIKCEGIFCIN